MKEIKVVDAKKGLELRKKEQEFELILKKRERINNKREKNTKGSEHREQKMGKREIKGKGKER